MISRYNIKHEWIPSHNGNVAYEDVTFLNNQQKEEVQGLHL